MWAPVCMYTWSAGPCPADSKEPETASDMSQWGNIAMRQQCKCLMKEGFSGEWAAGQLPASLRLFFLDLMQFFVVVRWFVTCRHKRNNFQSLTCRHSAWKPSDNHGVFGLSSVS